MYIRSFDPWKNKLCTCPSKFSLNPYTGCAHGCLYCYASSYIKEFFNCRAKQKLIESLQKEIKKISANSLISLCNTSDPYPPIEKKFELTRQCLKIFKEHEMRILIITKSDMVCRDVDLLKDMRSCVTITVTTLKHYKQLEPNAPSSYERFRALEKLSKDLPTGLRLDPIIPFINEYEIESILKLARESGVKHVTASTFKPRWDNWKKLKLAYPEFASSLNILYYKNGQKIGNSRYLSTDLRKKIIFKVKQICDSFSFTFSSCREGFPELNTSSSCDASHLIR
ncbi:MAG TPA: radical SAM protein [Thermodesulfovibrio thiophilus]|nr:radical SAM protein [Thermodesulfovibrio thiophilus]